MLLTYKGPVPAEAYVRWVKASLNLHLGSPLRDDATTGPDYRAWVKAFQARNGIPQSGEVNLATQDKLVWHNHANGRYVNWLAAVLQDVRPGISGPLWNPGIKKAVRETQALYGVTPMDGIVGPKTDWMFRDLISEGVLRWMAKPGVLW